MTEIVPPDERECERCGHRDVWDADRGAWRVATDDDGNPEQGTPHCLHDWDINGTYSAVKRDA